MTQKRRGNLLAQLQKTFSDVNIIKKMAYFRYTCCCRCEPRTKRMKQMLMKSQSSLQKEMDLKKFIMRQRLQTISLLSLLNGRQSFFVDRLSQMVVRESSNFEWTSSDQNLSDKNRDSKITHNVQSMTNSTNKIDQRLLNIFIMRQAHQEGLKFGFENDVTTKSNSWGRNKEKHFHLHKHHDALTMGGAPKRVHWLRRMTMVKHQSDDGLSVDLSSSNQEI